MRYMVWQLPVNHPDRFRERKVIDICDYVPVYQGEITGKHCLGRLWDMFNDSDQMPTGYAACSMSVGDLIHLDDEWYQVAEIGWNKLVRNATNNRIFYAEKKGE